jgi:hypothetical protein
VLLPRDKASIQVVGSAGPGFKIGREVKVAVTLDSLKFDLTTKVVSPPPSMCTCGCDRSQERIAELRQQGGSTAEEIRKGR